MVQLRLAMGEVKDQKAVLTALENIQKTWEDLLDKATVPNRNQPLGQIEKCEKDKWDPDGYYYAGHPGHTQPLLDQSHPATAVCLWIYQSDSYVFSTLNHASRFQDESKVTTLGPFAAALYQILKQG